MASYPFTANVSPKLASTSLRCEGGTDGRSHVTISWASTVLYHQSSLEWLQPAAAEPKSESLDMALLGIEGLLSSCSFGFSKVQIVAYN